MSIVVGTNSFITEEDADSYFDERLGASDVWVSGVNKEAALISAFRVLTNHPEYSIPTTVSLITAALRYAQCEQALFMLRQGEAIDRRMELQSMNVLSAGIVGETYKDTEIVLYPITPLAAALLSEYRGGDGFPSAAVVSLERDETETGE